MKELTAKDAARNFSALLTAVERGESFVLTRSGKRVAQVGPVRRGNVRALKDVLVLWQAAEVLNDEFESAVADAVGSADPGEDTDPWND